MLLYDTMDYRKTQAYSLPFFFCREKGREQFIDILLWNSDSRIFDIDTYGVFCTPIDLCSLANRSGDGENPSVGHGLCIIENNVEQNLRDGLDVEINVSELPAGIYFIQIIDSMGTSQNLKFIKQ